MRWNISSHLKHGDYDVSSITKFCEYASFQTYQAYPLNGNFKQLDISFDTNSLGVLYFKFCLYGLEAFTVHMQTIKFWFWIIAFLECSTKPCYKYCRCKRGFCAAQVKYYVDSFDIFFFGFLKWQIKKKKISISNFIYSFFCDLFPTATVLQQQNTRLAELRWPGWEPGGMVFYRLKQITEILYTFACVWPKSSRHPFLL